MSVVDSLRVNNFVLILVELLNIENIDFNNFNYNKIFLLYLYLNTIINIYIYSNKIKKQIYIHMVIKI